MKKIIKFIVTLIFILSLTTIVNQKQAFAKSNEASKNVIEIDEEMLEEYFMDISLSDINIDVIINNQEDNKLYYAVTRNITDQKWSTALHINKITILINHNEINGNIIDDIIKIFTKGVKLEKTFDINKFRNAFSNDFLKEVYKGLLK